MTQLRPPNPSMSADGQLTRWFAGQHCSFWRAAFAKYSLPRILRGYRQRAYGLICGAKPARLWFGALYAPCLACCQHASLETDGQADSKRGYHNDGTHIGPPVLRHSRRSMITYAPLPIIPIFLCAHSHSSACLPSSSSTRQTCLHATKTDPRPLRYTEKTYRTFLRYAVVWFCATRPDDDLTLRGIIPQVRVWLRHS